MRKQNSSLPGKNAARLLSLLETRSVDALAELVSFYFLRPAPARGRRWGLRGKSTVPAFPNASFFIDFFDSYKRLNATPGFGDFNHAPPRRGSGPAASCRLPVSRGGTNAMRAAADYFLYAPGPRARRLLLDARGSGASAADLAADMAVYALAKAAWLGLRLQASVTADRAALNPERRRRLKDLGVSPAAETA